MRIKLLINVFLSFVFAYSLYASVNYLILFFENPVLSGDKNYYFLGNMMLFIPFTLISLISAALLIIRLFRNKEKTSRRKENERFYL